MIRLTSLFFILFLGFCTVSAQDINTTKVNVVEGFKPIIPESSRLNENAIFADTLKIDKTQRYEVIESELESDFQIKPFRSAIVKPDKISKLFGSSVSFGTGYRVASQASVLHNSKRSRVLSYGFLFDHINNNVKIDNKEAGISRNTTYLYAKNIDNNKVYFLSMEYDRRGVFSYGRGILDRKDYNNTITQNNPFYNRFSFSKILFSVRTLEKKQIGLNHNTTFFVSDLNEFSENQIHLSSSLMQTINGFPFNLNIVLDDYLNYNNKDSRFESIALQSFRLSPAISLFKYGIDFNLGLDLQYLSDGSPLSFAPQIEGKKQLVKDILLVYGGFRHANQIHTFKSLSDVNPYIHSFGTNQSIRDNTDDIVQELESTDIDELYVGVRNNLGDEQVFLGNISYGKVSNFAFFEMIDSEDYNRFNIEYRESVLQLHVNIDYTTTINRIISIEASFDYYDWDQEIYNTPSVIGDISVPINLREKIRISSEITYQGMRISDSGNLPDLLHTNIYLYYLYSSQLSAYIKLNNLTNSKKELWYGYKDIGFNAALGLSYSF